MHTPVLLSEVVDLLRPGPGQLFIDSTVGLGGHAEALVPRLLPDGRLLGIDRDAAALELAAERLAPFGDRVELLAGDFRHVAQLAGEAGFAQVHGLLFDLGVSSMQLDRPDRGFSFAHDGPLDMRMDPGQRQTAAMLLRRASARDLERIFRDYGEERFARRIARAVVEQRGRLRTTRDLADLVARVVPRRERRIHPATRVFQAVRIAVNDEMGALEAALSAVPDLLAPGGRAAVISFHSIEDRMVKQAFRKLAAVDEMELVTRKPIRATEAEVADNRRARSARLRVAERRAR